MRMDDRDRSTLGGIEGLPLQLMIIIIVATMGLAIIVGWMGNIETPLAIGDVMIEDDTVGLHDGILDDITITVLDQDGNVLEGATVILDGLNVRQDGGTAYSITGTDGIVTFTDLTVTHSGTNKVGFIDVLVTKSGYSESNGHRITVIF